MRAFAVIVVLFYHAKVPGFSGGYLGVDVFFVVSGYLITRQIVEEIGAGTFSYANFYWRRIRRLMPAALVVIFATLVLHEWFLAPSIAHDFLGQVVAASLFAGNIGAWMQSGYFSPGSELKPLLHFWSLAVEEQFYLLFPCLLLVCGSRRTFAVLAVTVISLALCFALRDRMPGAVFYLLPTRAWELGIGALLALAPWNSARPFPSNRKARHGLVFVSLGTLFLLAHRPSQPAHPSVDALLVCFATAALIAANAAVPRICGVNRVAVKLGDMSYSLYLVHWPLFAFAANANVSGGGLPWFVRLALLGASFPIAWLLYQQVESRFRARPNTHRAIGRDFGVFAACTFAIVFAALLLRVLGASDEANLSTRLAANTGLHPKCAQAVPVFTKPDECVSASTPEILLWGDSYAMHWADALTQNGMGLVQATRPTCAPVLGLAAFDRKEFSETWARGCIAFNDSVYALLQEPSPEIVVLGGMWGYLATENALDLSQQTSELEQKVGLSGEQRLLDRTKKTVERLRAIGKRVIMLDVPPPAGFNSAACIERRDSGLLKFGIPGDSCDFSIALSAHSDSILARIARHADVPLLRIQHAICRDDGQCRAQVGDVIIYRDSGHLSFEGARYIAHQLDLPNRIRSEAR